MNRSLEAETTILANKLRDILGSHMTQIETHGHKQILASCLTALAIEVGRLKWLCVSSENIDPVSFDDIFKDAMRKHYNSNVKRYGTTN